MSLAPGQSLSHYEILGPPGSGGMGEVYRAKDTRLDREVAIKVLPEHFADDEERLRRFEREAKSLAALNHPNVAQIFGVDQVDDTCFLVLELVPGETLEDRIARGPVPWDEAVEICRQIAEGVEAAHDAGVIHRDLKPANVRITPDGKVKVLDFGLAKPTGPNAENESTTDSVLATAEGRLLGTPTYMAPEQARGKPIDRRVDVLAQLRDRPIHLNASGNDQGFRSPTRRHTRPCESPLKPHTGHDSADPSSSGANSIWSGSASWSTAACGTGTASTPSGRNATAN